MLEIETRSQAVILPLFPWGHTMNTKSSFAIAAIVSASMLAGCAADGTLLQTGSITDEPATSVAAKPKVDPACVALVAKIDGLRQEGTPSRLEKVASGKTPTASVKREALARMSELDKANAEFQAKCSTMGTMAATTPTAPAATPSAPAATTPTTAAAPATTAAKAATAATNAADTAAQVTAAAKAAEAAKAQTQTAAKAVSAAAAQ